MKTIVSILILFGLLGCGQERRRELKIQQGSSLSEKTIEKRSVDEFRPTINIPRGFRLDTIQKKDTIRNLSIFISLPVSGLNQIDKVIFADLENQKKGFIKNLDEISEEAKKNFKSDFQIEPISVFKDNKVTSYLFIVSFYCAGAAHPKTMYYSFNFDNKTYKRIYLSDCFIFKTKADSSHMTDLIAKAIGREGAIVPDLINIDFNIEQDTISFNFDDYEITANYADGILQGRLHKQQLKDMIRMKYR